MITNGFVFGVSDDVTLDATFSYRSKLLVSTYIYVHGTAGNIVYRNSVGDIQYVQAAALGYNPIAASAILSSGEVNGVVHNTTATGLVYCGSVKY